MKRHGPEGMKGNTHTPIKSQTQGFEAYIVIEEQREKETKRESSMRKGKIQPFDTKESLKRKRNGGVCEWSGCTQTLGLEWHHKSATRLAGDGKNSAEGVYRKISNFRPTENENLLDAYEMQMESCTLLCKKHHKETHTQYLREKTQMEQCATFLLSLLYSRKPGN